VTGVFSQKKTSVIEGGVKICSQTRCKYFILELNHLLNTPSLYVIYKGEGVEIKYRVKDMIKYLISTSDNIYYSYQSTPNNLIYLMYPHQKELKEILQIHASS
jgi:hypothetical protein